MHRYQILAVVGWIILATMSQAARYNRVVDLGQAAPPWSELATVDGHTYAIDSLRGADAIVIVFTCNHCPYAQAWEKRLVSAANTYSNRSVRFALISANDPVAYPEDSFDEMKARAESQNYPFPYLFDDSQNVARSYGAERTPEVFVLDANQHLRYHGAVDDNSNEDEVSQHWMRDALDNLTTGSDLSVVNTTPVGCTIKWR